MLIGDINKIKARKNHRCNWCGQTINVGEVYQRSFNKYDSDVYTWKNHLFCQKVANELNMFDWCDEGVTDDDFSEVIDDTYSEIMRDKEDVEYPSFRERYIVVLNHLKVEHTL